MEKKETSLKMNVEVPEFKRCCLCLPLRRSLIAWGYLKMIVLLLTLIYFSVSWWDLFVVVVKRKMTYLIGYFILLSVMVALLTTDIILNVLLVVGAHKKKALILKVYYFCSAILLILTFLMGFANFVIIINSRWPYLDQFFMLIVDSNTPVYLVDLILQMYILLLVRSEIVKLNNAAQAECFLDIEDTFEKEISSIDCNSEEKV